MNRQLDRPIKIAVLFFVFSFICLASSALAEKLTMTVALSDDALKIQASLDQETYSYTTDKQDMIVQKLMTIYYLLEPKPDEIGTLENANRFLKQQWDSLRGLLQPAQGESQRPEARTPIAIAPETRALLEKVGLSLFRPIHSFVQAATSIEFVITGNELRFPLDALFYQGSPLFIQKPVVYSFAPQPETHFSIPKDVIGCLISDPTTASGRAVLSVKDFFPNARHFNSQEIRAEDLQTLGSTGILLICASGGSEGIELPHLAIRSWSLPPLKPGLVFLDTGKLGLSMDFMKGFQQAGTRYYIAPIFGLKSDSASTKTMERFFQALSKGNSPSYAMYLTRKTIFDESLMQDNDFKWVMLQAFPFRVYRLN